MYFGLGAGGGWFYNRTSVGIRMGERERERETETESRLSASCSLDGRNKFQIRRYPLVFAFPPFLFYDDILIPN
jgi:hypothetical protein